MPPLLSSLQRLWDFPGQRPGKGCGRLAANLPNLPQKIDPAISKRLHLNVRKVVIDLPQSEGPDRKAGADDKTREGRAGDRRVEVRVLKSAGTQAN